MVDIINLLTTRVPNKAKNIHSPHVEWPVLLGINTEFVSLRNN